MGAGASAAGASSWSPAKAQAAPATAALSDLAKKSGTPVAELLGMAVPELAKLVEKQGIKAAALASRAAEMGIAKAKLNAATKDGSAALLSLIQQTAYQEAGKKSGGAKQPEPEPEPEPRAQQRPQQDEEPGQAADPGSLPVKAWMGNDPVIKSALETVGVKKPNPSENDLRKCFHRSALKWHPDKNSSAEAKVKFQEISDAYTVLIEAALSGATGAAAGAMTVVTSPGNWMALAAALDEVCATSERWPLLVDGTGDGKVCLEIFGGGGTTPRVVDGPHGYVSDNPTLKISGKQISTSCAHAFRIKPFPIECPIFCRVGMKAFDSNDINTHIGYAYCCCHLTPVITPPTLGLSGDGAIVTLAGYGARALPPKAFIHILCDALSKAKPLIIDLTASHHKGSASKKLMDLRFALEGARRETLAGLRSAAGDAEQQAEALRESALKRAERNVPTLQKEAEAAKDRALLALLKGEIDQDEFQSVKEAALGKVREGKGMAEDMRAKREAKLKEAKEEKQAAADHKEKMKQVKKEKPKKPTKGPDSSLLCFNLETRKVILAEAEFKGANMGAVGAELRKRWSEQSMEQQMEWDKKAQANKAQYKLDMEAYQQQLDVYNGKADAVASKGPAVAPGGPRVDPEFLRRNFKGWLMKPDGLYLALMEKTLHLQEQYRPLFIAAGRADELEQISASASSGNSAGSIKADGEAKGKGGQGAGGGGDGKGAGGAGGGVGGGFRLIVLTTVDCVPAELESKMLEVRTVKSAEHLTDKEKAMGLLEREIVRAMEIGEFGDDRSAQIMAAAEDNEQFGFA